MSTAVLDLIWLGSTALALCEKTGENKNARTSKSAKVFFIKILPVAISSSYPYIPPIYYNAFLQNFQQGFNRFLTSRF